MIYNVIKISVNIDFLLVFDTIYNTNTVLFYLKVFYSFEINFAFILLIKESYILCIVPISNFDKSRNHNTETLAQSSVGRDLSLSDFMLF